MTGLWAFEVQLPYQKYQGPPIVVRLMFSQRLEQNKTKNKWRYSNRSNKCSKIKNIDNFFLGKGYSCKCDQPERTKTDGVNSQSKSWIFFQKWKFLKIIFVKKFGNN